MVYSAKNAINKDAGGRLIKNLMKRIMAIAAVAILLITGAMAILSFVPFGNSGHRTVVGTIVEFGYYQKMNDYDVYRTIVNQTGKDQLVEYFMYFGSGNITYPIVGKTYKFTYENTDIENVYHVYDFIEQ